MKIVEKFKYSNKSFKGYRIRGILNVITLEGTESKIDFYTDNTNGKEVVLIALKKLLKQPVKSINIYHWTTKEQDDKAIELINETLKEL